ncbi:MAG: GGDEF domain-containing protein [Chloroflexi bacterium]|nr:MAG: GGDEF domain-containing protein [Chloroflexota bacterium]
MTPPTEQRPSVGAEDQRIRRSWLIFAGTFFALGLISAMRLLGGGAGPLDLAMTALIVVVGFAAIRHRLAVQQLEEGRRAEAESFARILQGLSRSISPDAIVGAIVEELGIGTAADHVVIVRRRPDARVLEATLVNARTGGSTSSTVFPIGDLEDPPSLDDATERDPVGIPIDVDGDGAPVEIPVDAAPAGRPRLGASVGAVAAGGPPRSGRRMPDVGPTAAIAEPPAVAIAPRPGRVRPPDPRRLVAERIAKRARAVFGLRHTLVAPLATDAGQIGALLISRRTASGWSPSAQRILNGAAIEASAALSRAYSHRDAEARAATDGLTGLPNRRYFDEFCALLARRRRAEDTVGVLMIDIDRFKGLNDAHGHVVGDDVLRAVAAAIAAAVREDDVPARYGGEEFAVLLRNPTLAVAVDVGERVRSAVGRLDLHRFGVGPVSVSVGAAVADGPDEPIVAVVEHADRALYLAKRRGRDQVVAA